MTFKELLEVEHSYRIDRRLREDCPVHYGYEDWNGKCPVKTCEECWNRQAPENIVERVKRKKE